MSNELKELPPIFSKRSEKANIEKRNAVIDEFLDSLDNKKKRLNGSDYSENNEDNEIDDIFENAKVLKKEHDIDRETNKKIKRPNFYGRKISSLLLSNKNELNTYKYSTLSFENESFSNNKDNNKIKIINNHDNICQTNVSGNKSSKGNKKSKILPILDITHLELRNSNIGNNFLTYIQSNSIKSEKNMKNNITHNKNNNSKWKYNEQLLDKANPYFSKNSPILNHMQFLKQMRSKSHIGNRMQNNNLKAINRERIALSPNLIAAELYRHSSFFQKGLKRNYTAKLNNKMKSFKAFSNSKDANKNSFKTINYNTKKLFHKNKSLRKILNRNENFGFNWINTVINNENKIANKHELSKKQLKLKLTELEANCKLKNERNYFIKEKK